MTPTNELRQVRREAERLLYYNLTCPLNRRWDRIQAESIPTSTMTTALFTRTRPGYLISSSPSLLSLPAISAAFASPMMYWCKPLPTASLQTCLSNSFNLGLYTKPTDLDPASSANPKQIGFARLITDHVTLAYLTDVYVLEEEQGKGLGRWLIACMDEVLKEMGYLRRVLLITNEGGGERFYEKELGMKTWGKAEGGMVIMNRTGAGGVRWEDANEEG